MPLFFRADKDLLVWGIVGVLVMIVAAHFTLNGRHLVFCKLFIT